MKYNKNSFFLKHPHPGNKLLVLCIPLLLLSFISASVGTAFSHVGGSFAALATLARLFDSAAWIFVSGAVSASLVALIMENRLTDADKIKLEVQKGLFAYEYGNPLNLKEGERLPKIRCKKVGKGLYEITVTTVSRTVEDIQKIASSISSSLNKRYARYAVTESNADVAFNEVSFRIEDVKINRSLTVNSVNDLTPKEHTKLIIQDGTYIDLTTSGSMIFAGKTRSGKTTGAISVLLQALLAGRDKYGSEIVIIDPKMAELSQLPHTFTLDEDGEARRILEAMMHFETAIRKRQQALNNLSIEKGDAVHWWDAGFHSSILFIDEYVALRNIFPKRASKEDSEYSLAAFDSVLKRIVTMGASAGCYVMISIAEASVDEGGLPAMLRSACSTKILFRPTLPEGRFLWDSERLKDMPQRTYGSGDAWFSSTDGVHDSVSYVHFPALNFPVYRELGRLLAAYYRVS